ncbi:hypothetical protein DAPPUDRAFT_111193 [Daphnia pulex]|uniref:CCHC-type domain-containing protein n=1 Tax=Daphnia pulex TaxID=6669 RepID=E9H8H5_DAPPU|nr:hypothetical protein DAPPUDRAFT_111193 [Daphnia pulex]|eukprot:EFX71976.1 hypothetical protein DAPPUDRAFT_111193 [Daphnia pulex]
MAVNTSKDVGHIAKFDGTNFPSWKYGIWMLLEKNRLTSIVDGSVTKPVENSDNCCVKNIRDDGVIENIAEIDVWKQQDVDARTYIYSTIKNEQQANLQGCTTSHQMWTRIQTEYAELAAENGHLLMAKFFDYKFQPASSQFRGGYRGNRGNFRGNRGGHPYRGDQGSNYIRPQCTYKHCGKPGHTADKCRKRIRDESNNQDFGYTSAFMNFSTRRGGHKQFSLYTQTNECRFRAFDWFADSGATQNIVITEKLLTSTR